MTVIDSVSRLLSPAPLPLLALLLLPALLLIYTLQPAG